MRTERRWFAMLAVLPLVTGLALAWTVSPAGAASGVTVAGGRGLIESGSAVAVDSNRNVYVADDWHHWVQRWAPGATSGVTVAGGNGTGWQDNQISYPEGLAIDTVGNLYVTDSGNQRVQRWAPGATSGVTVAGGHGFGSAADQFDNPAGLALDPEGGIYVADSGNYRIQYWAPGATSGVTVAGGHGPGSGADQFGISRAASVAVDSSRNVYVADTGNQRVQRWPPGAASGVTVAGGNGGGPGADQFLAAQAVVVDGSRNVYVADQGNNRVQRWAPGATSGVTVAGGNGAGSAADQLWAPRVLALDDSADVYVYDSGNFRVQRWAAVGATVQPGGGVVVAPMAGSADLDVAVTLDTATPTPVTVSWTTLDVPGAPTSPIIGPPAPPSDYTASSGVVTFGPLQTTAHVTIPVVGSTAGGDYEYVVVSFRDPTGATMGGLGGLGFGVIESAAHAAPPRVLPGTGTVGAPDSGTVDLQLPVALSSPSSTPVTVPWTTLYVPGAPSTRYGGQAPLSDYTAASGVVTFAPGQTATHVIIPVNSNTEFDSEYFLVSFHDPTGANMGGTWGLGVGVITKVFIYP